VFAVTAPEESRPLITSSELTELIRHALPDAQVEAVDRTGTRDHYNLKVVSQGFAGMSPLDQHRLVYKALGLALGDGRLHAVEIKTELPQKKEAS
jgi:stress-induced morphogen